MTPSYRTFGKLINQKKCCKQAKVRNWVSIKMQPKHFQVLVPEIVYNFIYSQAPFLLTKTTIIPPSRAKMTFLATQDNNSKIRTNTT